MRTPVLLALALALAACKQSPPGKCSGNDGCGVGQECAGGVCVRFDTDHQLGSRCIRDGDCVAWGRCAGEVCALAPGHCLDGSGCEPNWQRCSFETFTCETAAGFCGGPAECQSWQTCGADHLCATAPGRCAGPGDCAAWETCSASHACALAAGKCNGPADCAPAQRCDGDHTCFDPPLLQTDVVIVGAILNQTYGWAPVNHPTEAHVGLTDRPLAGFIDPSGRVVYSALTTSNEIKRFVPDSMTWDAGHSLWQIPSPDATGANDPTLATTTDWCPMMESTRFVMQAETGALLLNCMEPPSPDWYWCDESGRRRAVGVRVLAWSADDHMLASSFVGANPGAVIDPAGNVTAIRNLPADAEIRIARVHPSGFRITTMGALDQGTGTRLTQSWLVARDGAATLEGTYADPPPNTRPDYFDNTYALGADGALYQFDSVHSLIMRRDLAPGSSSVVYDAILPQGYGDPSARTFRPYVIVSRGTFITAP